MLKKLFGFTGHPPFVEVKVENYEGFQKRQVGWVVESPSMPMHLDLDLYHV